MAYKINGTTVVDNSRNVCACCVTSCCITASSRMDAPSGNTASRPGSPATGSVYFDTDLGALIAYNGTDWVASGADSLDSDDFGQTYYANFKYVNKGPFCRRTCYFNSYTAHEDTQYINTMGNMCYEAHITNQYPYTSSFPCFCMNNYKHIYTEGFGGQNECCFYGCGFKNNCLIVGASDRAGKYGNKFAQCFGCSTCCKKDANFLLFNNGSVSFPVAHYGEQGCGYHCACVTCTFSETYLTEKGGIIAAPKIACVHAGNCYFSNCDLFLEGI